MPFSGRQSTSLSSYSRKFNTSRLFWTSNNERPTYEDDRFVKLNKIAGVKTCLLELSIRAFHFYSIGPGRLPLTYAMKGTPERSLGVIQIHAAFIYILKHYF